MNTFLRWWVIVAAISVGFVFFSIYDGWNYVNESDFTKISFIIVAIFGYCTIEMGYCSFSKFCNPPKVSRFMVGIMTKMGMTGTAIGFARMLYVFCKSDLESHEEAMAAIHSMAHGMSTAIVTTIAGLICSILLQFQLFNYDYEN